METKVKTTVKMETDNLQFGFWRMDETGEDGRFVPLDNASASELEELAPLLGLTPLGVDAFNMLVESIKEDVGADLMDIWKRLDQAGIE